MHSNVPLSPRLLAALGRIQCLGNQEAHTFRTDAAAAPALLDALDEAKAAFREAGLGRGKVGRRGEAAKVVGGSGGTLKSATGAVAMGAVAVAGTAIPVGVPVQ